MNEIFAVLPEATLTAFACLVLLVDVSGGARSQAMTFWVAVIAVLAVLVEIAIWFPEHTVNAFMTRSARTPCPQCSRRF